MFLTSKYIREVFFLHSSLLLLKTLCMALLIGRWRLKKRVFISPEDAVRNGTVTNDDPDIERIRRAHMNDIENIPVFILSALLYTATKPYPIVAANLIRLYTVSRYLHTYVYVNNVPQPARAWCFRIGFLVNIYMLIQTAIYFSW